MKRVVYLLGLLAVSTGQISASSSEHDAFFERLRKKNPHWDEATLRICAYGVPKSQKREGSPLCPPQYHKEVYADDTPDDFFKRDQSNQWQWKWNQSNQWMGSQKGKTS